MLYLRCHDPNDKTLNARARDYLRGMIEDHDGRYFMPEAVAAGVIGSRMEAALAMVLLFHGCEPWTAENVALWQRLQTEAGRPMPSVEATTRVLCDTIREVLGDRPSETPKTIAQMDRDELEEYVQDLGFRVEMNLPPGPSHRGRYLFSLILWGDSMQFISNSDTANVIKAMREAADRLEKGA